MHPQVGLTSKTLPTQVIFLIMYVPLYVMLTARDHRAAHLAVGSVSVYHSEVEV